VGGGNHHRVYYRGGQRNKGGGGTKKTLAEVPNISAFVEVQRKSGRWLRTCSTKRVFSDRKGDIKRGRGE